MTQNNPDNGQQLRAIKRPKKRAVSLGVSLILVGLSLNKWSLERIAVHEMRLGHAHSGVTPGKCVVVSNHREAAL